VYANAATGSGVADLPLLRLSEEPNPPGLLEIGSYSTDVPGQDSEGLFTGDFVASYPAVLSAGQPTTTLNFTGRPLVFNAEVSPPEALQAQPGFPGFRVSR
jgi:hypothetical protein